MFSLDKIIRSGTRCHPFHLVLATALAWAILSAHAGPGPEPGEDQPQLSVMVLPAITGDDDQARGPQIAVRWSGELPVQLQPGVKDAAGRWQARGEPIELNEPMSLLPAPDQVGDMRFRVHDATGAVLASARGEAETFGWTPTFVGPGLDYDVHATTVYDGDLIVGGYFLTAGQEVVNHIARWDGSAWSALDGPNGTGMNDEVDALTIHNGDLIAGGRFSEAGGETVNHIARWDGSQWSALSGPNGTGMNNQVRALTVHNGDLIAGGSFAEAGGVTVNRIARWDGSHWSALSGPNDTGMSGSVEALTVHNGDLIAGGRFSEAGGETVNRIARWNGSQWSALSGPNGTGMSGTVFALTVHNNDLIAGGHFTQAGGETVNRIARWDGSQWSALSGPNGTGVNNAVWALTVHNGDLIVGGWFTEAGDETVNYIARWDGSEWSALSGPNGTGMNNSVGALTVHNGALIAGGDFTQAGGEGVNYIACWDDSQWSALSDPNGPSGAGMSRWVYALTVHNNDLIAGGQFTQAGDGTVNRIARWDGSQWSALSGPNGTGMNDSVRALTVHNGDLIAGGWFTEAGGETVNRIARWDGSEWSALSGPNGTGMNGGVSALTVHNGDLIAGGSFAEAGGEGVNYIARWDGSDWSALSGPNGTGMNSTVYALTVHNGDLIAGGSFAEAGGVTVNRIARWNGSQWSALSGPNGTGMNHQVRALTIYNGDLIAGGRFSEAGGETVNNIARWDGSQWSDLSGPNGTGMDDSVYALTVHNDDLIAGGLFTQAGGETINHIARWDGSQWSALSGPNGNGINGDVEALTVHNGDLMAGGEFIQAGGLPAWNLAHWELEATVTELVLVEHEVVDPGEPVMVTATVDGPVSTPDGGLRGRIEADSGEFCEATVTPESGTTATFSCEFTFDQSGIRTLTAHYTGSARYHPSQSESVAIFVNWFTLEVEVTGQGSVTAASPAPAEGAIVDCDEDATGSSACMAGYDKDDVVALSLDPASDWFIDAIDGCGGELVGTTYTTAPMADDCTVMVAFTTEHTLNYTAGPGGSLDGATTQTVLHGESGTPVTAVPDTGYYFVQWSDELTDNPRVDTNVIADVDVEAEWQLLVVLDAVSPASGPSAGGTAVTLSGTAFQAGAVVSLGGNACSNVDVVSSTEISCDTPPGTAGAVDVVVENPDSQTAMLSDGFTYIDAPTLSAITPASGPGTGGTTVTLSGTAFQAGAVVSFGGNACSNVDVVSSTEISCDTPPGSASTVDVVVENPDGQTATLSNGFNYVFSDDVFQDRFENP